MGYGWLNGVTLKDDREKGVAERESGTRLAERKGYGWLNGGQTDKDDREWVRLAEWGHTLRDDREKSMAEWGSHTKGSQRERGMAG